MIANDVRISSALAGLIGQARLDLTQEARTQADLYQFLAARLALGRTIEREVRLSPEDRVDFLIDGRIVVEVKLKKGNRAPAVLRQLERYAAHDGVAEIILVSNLAMNVPDALNGKPVSFVSLGRAWV